MNDGDERGNVVWLEANCVNSKVNAAIGDEHVLPEISKATLSFKLLLQAVNIL